MMNKNRRKILLAVDGSDQAMEAVRYISEVVLPEQTEIVLFYVGTGFPEVFWDMGVNPLYQSKKQKVMGWLADHQLVIGEFKEIAFKVLADAGLPQDAVSIKTQTKKTKVLKDIIQESYRGYSAIVMGRTGTSKLKDFFVGSMAYKLAKKIKHIPTVVVGGKPEPKRVLIALDDSMEAMRGVSSVAAMVRADDLEYTLCHCLSLQASFRMASDPSAGDGDEVEWREYNKNRFRPYMDEAAQRLMDAGIDASRISCEFQFFKGNIIKKIIETALVGGFGTVVVGRRETAGFGEAHTRGRFGEKIIGSLENIAVWVVS